MTTIRANRVVYETSPRPPRPIRTKRYLVQGKGPIGWYNLGETDVLWLAMMDAWLHRIAVRDSARVLAQEERP